MKSKEQTASDFIDKIVEFAKATLNLDEFEPIRGLTSIYTNSSLDDCGRQHQVDIRAYYERDDDDEVENPGENK